MVVPDAVAYTLLTGAIGAGVGAIFKAHRLGGKFEDFAMQSVARMEKMETRQEKHDDAIATMQITAERTSTQLEAVNTSLARIERYLERAIEKGT